MTQALMNSGPTVRTPVSAARNKPFISRLLGLYPSDSPMPNDSGVMTASFADILGISGPMTVPDAMMAAACALNVAGNLLSTTCAMRVTSPLSFMPTPRPNAANKSHHVSPANDANTVSTGIPATAMNSTAMMKAVTISEKMRRTHHTMAHTRMPIA